MEILEVFLINLFMLGENASNHNNQRIRDTTIIECEGFKFTFKQLNIHLKQSDFINQSLITTKITIENIRSDQVEQLLNIIDDFCSLLSFAQQSPVLLYSHKIGSLEYSTNCSGIVVNPLRSIIENAGKEIRNFIEQAYPTFKKLKSTRQLIVVFGYLCEANRSSLAQEISLISHYVAIENLKQTFALDNQYEYTGQYFSHKQFPPLDIAPLDLENYWPPKGKIKKYIHKTYGKISSTEMTFRMFEAMHFKRDEIKLFLTKRHKIIHEGLLLPFADPNYAQTALENFYDVSDLLRQYLLTLLKYKNQYYRSRDRLGPSVCLNLISNS